MKKISLKGSQSLTKPNIFSIFGSIMRKFYVFSAAFMAILLLSCSSKQVGLKENWIDERDVIALRDGPVSQWMIKAGRPVLVELIGDTNIYYYNYRPTMYAAAVYDSTTFFATWGKASEIKPALENATEIWGSRKNIIQIKAVNDVIVSAVVTEGADQKTFVRDLNGNIVLDSRSGFNSNISQEQKISSASKDYSKALSSLSGKNTWPPKTGPIVPVEPEPAPAAAEQPAAEPVAEPAGAAAEQPAAEPHAAAAEPHAEPAAEPHAAEPAPAAEPHAATEHKPAEPAHEPAAHNPTAP
jgi:hypothetical protein